jgi:aldose 1-epimerase
MENPRRAGLEPRDIMLKTYGSTPDGRPVGIHTLTNGNGLEARLTEFGAILVSLKTPDRDGRFADITLGYDSLDGWLANPPYFGATIGRFGNRIARGQFTLNGNTYQLARNEGGVNHLHGGPGGFHKQLWESRAPDDSSVEFSLLSRAGDEGYPGNLRVRVVYKLTDDDELVWEAAATTDAPTILNLVHHSYWNLTGDATLPVTGHELTLNAPYFLPTDAAMIPTGEVRSVERTPMDFRTAHRIGTRIDDDYGPLRAAGGFDHCWVLEKRGKLHPAAVLYDPASGRLLELSTDQPGIQVYTGNFLDGTITGKNGTFYQKRTGICLETENFPDAPNHPTFPSCVLRPGETYRHTMVHRFSVR